MKWVSNHFRGYPGRARHSVRAAGCEVEPRRARSDAPCHCHRFLDIQRLRWRNCFRGVVTAVALIVGFARAGGAEVRPQIQHVEFGPSIFSDGQQRAGVRFQDGAQAIAVPGGALWLFGDTFTTTGMVGTTIAFLPATKTNLPPALEYFVNPKGVVENPLALFPEESAATNRMWPLGGVAVGARIYLFYSMIEQTPGPGPWNFRSTGGGLAVADKPLQHFTRLRPNGAWKFPMEPIQVLREGEYLYLYEISSQPKGLVIARVPSAQIENPAAYEFYTGRHWSAQRTNAKVILREAYGQVSVVSQPDRRSYLMATSSDFFHPLEIQLREAEHPEGPWSAPVRVAVPELPGKKTKLVYGAYLHPELSDMKAQRLVATFCRILAGEWEFTNPEWVTITLVR